MMTASEPHQLKAPPHNLVGEGHATTNLLISCKLSYHRAKAMRLRERLTANLNSADNSLDRKVKRKPNLIFHSHIPFIRGFPLITLALQGGWGSSKY